MSLSMMFLLSEISLFSKSFLDKKILIVGLGLLYD